MSLPASELEAAGKYLNKPAASFVPRNEPNLRGLMKTKISALALIAATALSLAPKPAQAGDKGLAIVGGFLGGLIVASAINDSRHDACDSRYTTVIVKDRNDRCDDGYWKEVRVRTWVPGCWVTERGHHGRSCRRYVEGYYTYRTDRIWVSCDRSDHYDRHDRYDRNDDYRRGYGQGR